jgi:hypothetical protein
MAYANLHSIKTKVMETTHFCQSCSMPLDSTELMGTEKDGSKNSHYCKFCYQNGAFTDPDMTLGKMTAFIIHKMEDLKIPNDIIETAVRRLPGLDRWKEKVPQS